MENYNFWSDLEEMKFEIRIWLRGFNQLATAFCLRFSGYEFWQKMEANERVASVENAVRSVLQCSYWLQNSQSDYYILHIKIEVGEQSQRLEHTVLKGTWQRLVNWQRDEMIRILAASVLEWDFELIK